MILYHAARKLLGNQIIQDGHIKAFVKREWKLPPLLQNGKLFDPSSTQGFIYLSNDIFTAIAFANARAFIENENCIYIFEMEIDEEELIPDYDELAIKCGLEGYFTAQESLQLCKCVRVPRDIWFSQTPTRFCHIPSTLYGGDTTKEQALFTLELIKARSYTEDDSKDDATRKRYAELCQYISDITWKQIE